MKNEFKAKDKVEVKAKEPSQPKPKPQPEPQPKYILCAAIWYQAEKKCVLQPQNIDKGYVIAGRRHANIISTAMALGVITGKADHIQGFLTNDNFFVDRQEAAKIAFKSGQTEQEVDHLNSEHLY